MGTPEFAVPSLEALINTGYEVCLVVTQPDKPKGRGNKIQPPPIKETALKHGIEIYQPEKVKNKEFVNKLKSHKADLMVTAAYGKLLTKDALEATKLGCINVHASLLPKYRGAAPLWWVIINGEEKTGITTMYTDEGMDTGDILDKSEINIPKDMTVGELSGEMAQLGAKTLIVTLEKLKHCNITRTKQNDSEASHAPMIEKTTGLINWEKGAYEINNLIRGTNPWPCAYTFYDDKRMRIYKSEAIDSGDSVEADATNTLKPGTILEIDENGILVLTGKDKLLIKEVQFDSSKKMEVKDYIKGNKLLTGVVLNNGK